MALLAATARDRTYEPGAMIVAERESPDGFYLVLSGQVKLFKSSPEGKEQTLYVFEPGEPFCLCSLFGCDAFPANAAALTRTRVAVVGASSFAALARSEPQLLFNILFVVSHRLKEAMALVESLSLKEIPQRLAAFFLQAQAGPEGALRMAITHRELAKIVGITPEALSRSLRRMAEAGLLAVEGRDVRILDRAGLVRCADAGL